MASSTKSNCLRSLSVLCIISSMIIVGFVTNTLNAADPIDANAKRMAQKIYNATGVSGGLIIHLGSGDGELTAALKASDSYHVHGLDRDAANVAAARQRVQELGLYGSVSVEQLHDDQLPYIDNLANLVIAENIGNVPMSELLRILAPEGTAYVLQNGEWTKTVKPRPANIDQWTHFMHDPSGNAVAHDDVVGPPRRLQWVGSPRWSRHHDRMASMSAMVSSGGRVFYIMDEGSRVSIQLPSKWTLIARDAFNGVVLWKRSIESWQNHLWPLKSGPTQLARRLVAIDDRVYVTLGIDAPLVELDAATGETLQTYTETKGAEEVLLHEGVLVALTNKQLTELRKYGPALNVGDQARVRKDFHWNQKPRDIVAVEVKSGRLLWKKNTKVAPITLAAQGNRVFYHDGEKIVCLNRTTGQQNWTALAARRSAVTFNFGPKLVLYGKVVLFAGGDRTMRAFDIDSGKPLWTAPHAQSGYQSPEDLLVSGGLVWSAPTTQTRDTGVFTGRDPHTGEIKTEFPPNVSTYWFHHRCYMAKATDRYILPSRTGIEFVDHKNKDWEIHHWVRGGCLYGVMPCNGLLYAPPHNCACYPEAKLYGLNALAPASSTLRIDYKNAPGLLQKGPVFDAVVNEKTAAPGDWPTYRHDVGRSGSASSSVSTDLKKSWATKLGGRLSAVVVSGGRLYVAQIDQHTLRVLDAKSGQPLWSYTTGGRVDSPPTIYKGRVYFGSIDGWVYCLREEDGALIWRYRSAPRDMRLMAYEQLESVWPVHGSVLVQEDMVTFVSGRSMFLDGGMRLVQLDYKTGRKLSEVIMDETDPETGKNLQARLQTLQMPTGLPDILSSDGLLLFMRSQQFTQSGNRQQIGPVSGQAAEQGAAQQGDGAHLFAPMGFLDGDWFHRSYWVYGRNFAGGHNGYYQAGKYAPSGRMLVFDDEQVYGFARKPEHYRWTTIIEHQLFRSDKAAPKVAPPSSGGKVAMIRFKKTKSIDPTDKELTVEAWVKADRPDGVILARGGPERGYALIIRGGEARFVVRLNKEIFSVAAKKKVVGRWVHLTGVLSKEKTMQLYVDGELAAGRKVPGLIASDPAQSLEIGADDGGPVGAYRSPLAFAGSIDEVKIHHGAFSPEQIRARFEKTDSTQPAGIKLVLSCSFDKGDASDASGAGNHGTIIRAKPAKGKVGQSIRFVGRRGGNRNAGSFVKHHWNQDLPLLVNAMVLTDKALFVVGPPDLIEENETFNRLVNRDNKVNELLLKQDQALKGDQGAILWAISKTDGKKLAEYRLDALPVWDGMSAAGGRLYVSTKAGEVVCYGK